MDIKEFLDLSVGKWFSQRTSHNLNNDKTENNKADLNIEAILPDDRYFIQLCQQNHIDATGSLGGVKISWDNSVDWGKPKQVGSTALFMISNSHNINTGQFLRVAGSPSQTIDIGRYILGNDEALTLIVEAKDLYLEERQWFASPNLRLRNTLSKVANGVQQTSFYSEIRKAVPQAQPSEQNITTNA